ncbi:T9SS type A sorting domain-containing protein [Aequorivita sp. SDUM287046]|uniref:T9SS type A sorting domain-containing protein n=1 Tax=Aequorivita aurantiaca TaxID=3053356 RepID=A0ABT8DKF2_9FLAO|nr:T9SS type A sorting domain-containing protein [Aequorivita aurantiaca]MDN3724474.1 T9SS type A sorting domain-containing protein [Aequorivita aurantiaca]
MQKTIFTTLFFFLSLSTVFGQDYTTPNTGVTWTLDDIAAVSPSTITISGNEYTLWGNLTISENDTLEIGSNLTLSIDADLLITVYGTFITDANEIIITALDQNAPYEGFRFEEFSNIELHSTTFEYGGGLRVLTDNLHMVNCTLTNNVAGATTSAVIQLSGGTPHISACTISFNELPAIGSAANAQVSAFIFNNYIEGNNQENSNRPQINMGTTMANEQLQIIQNTIIGDRSQDMVGGIAIANFVGGTINTVIQDNIIKDNRYGITIIGPSESAEIIGNVIEDNDTQGDPLLGGSGISLNTSTAGNPVFVNGNEFRRNLWGITVIGEATINLGDGSTNSGMNIFSENGNGGEIYALYNNTANAISAMHNCWIEGQQSTIHQVEDVIFHNADDASLGEVTFEPFLCGVLDVADNTIENFSFYPNPVKNAINFNNIFSFEKLEIFGIQGNLISSETISEGQNTLPINLPSGLYFVNFSNDAQSVIKKMIVK